MNVAEFTSKWRRSERTERSAAQEHFLDLFKVVGHPRPGEADPAGEWFTFECRIGRVRYPRTVARGEESARQLARRTLTNLYNQRPAWLAHAHAQLDAAVASAYRLAADLPGAEILARLLQLNKAKR